MALENKFLKSVDMATWYRVSCSPQCKYSAMVQLDMVIANLEWDAGDKEKLNLAHWTVG